MDRPKIQILVLGTVTALGRHVMNVWQARGAGVIHWRDERDFDRAQEQEFDAVYDFDCPGPGEAHGRAEALQERVRKYVLVSTSQVYSLGEERSEAEFDPFSQLFRTQPGVLTPRDSRRQSEAALLQTAQFAVVVPRLATVLGLDDPSDPLRWIIERVSKGRRISSPAPDSRFSVVHYQDAVDFLVGCVVSAAQGPINVASPDPISLRELVRVVEAKLGRKAVLAQDSDPDARAPLGGATAVSLRTERLVRLGMECRGTRRWMSTLVGEIQS